MRPRRHVVNDPLGYAVSGEPFVTTDPVLAQAVARELDRVDPLPCHHENGDLHEVTTLGDRRPCFIRSCCGERVEYG